ncbi:MAG: WYL domain-containing protein [Bdellovibrionales bacterium]|nr:WYL domain-containing protein [Bdellovibrionales bacterium]
MTREQWQQNQEAIRDALLKGLFRTQQCEIEYQQLWRDEPVHWKIHPPVYLQRGPAFYLLCMINDFTDVRQLALHRMLSAKVLDDEARKPAEFNIDREVERAQGMGGSGEPICLALRFYRSAGVHLTETRLSADQIVVDEDDYHFRLTATVNDTAQLRWWLLSFGSKVEVLEPEGLREEMKQNAFWMNRKYSKPYAPAASPNSTPLSPEASATTPEPPTDTTSATED